MYRKRDSNESTIIKTLYAFKCDKVWKIECRDDAGCPDILCIYKNKYYAMEIKTDEGKLSEAQKENGCIPVVRNATEALRVIGINI